MEGKFDDGLVMLLYGGRVALSDESPLVYAKADIRAHPHRGDASCFGLDRLPRRKPRHFGRNGKESDAHGSD